MQSCPHEGMSAQHAVELKEGEEGCEPIVNIHHQLEDLLEQVQSL